MRRRRLLALLIKTSSIAAVAPVTMRVNAGSPDPAFTAPLPVQDVPSRRELILTAADFRFTPDRIEVVQDELVRISLRSGDIAHSFNVDEYRIAKRVAAGGTVLIEFRADRLGTFPFYCNITSEPGHDQMRGQLIVRAK